jgi:hypothetical protein
MNRAKLQKAELDVGDRRIDERYSPHCQQRKGKQAAAGQGY